MYTNESLTQWHAVGGAVVDGKVFYNIFSEVRASEHARIKKPIAKYFSQTGVAPLEPHVDAIITLLCRQIDEKFAADNANGPEFDFGRWALFCKTLPTSYSYNSPGTNF